MSGLIKPRAVPPRRGWVWVLEAFSLVTARWWWHVPLALLMAGALTGLPRLGRVVLGVTALCLFALLAEATAGQRPLVSVLRQHAGALLRLSAAWLAALAVMVSVLLALQRTPPAQALTELLRGAAPGAGQGSDSATRAAGALDFLPGVDLLDTVAVAVAAPGAFFFLALLLFLRTPWLVALDLAAEGVRLNSFVILLGLAWAALLVAAGAWSGLTVVAALPCSGALVVVAWRDVFLGQAPAEVAPRAAAAAPSARSAKATLRVTAPAP